MNRNVIETQWPQVREILREKFTNLTDDDIRQINGRYDQLVIKLQQKYGYSREEAEDRIRSWNFDRLPGYDNQSRLEGQDRRELRVERNIRDEDSSSAFKWILGLGIPLLLLGAYLLSTNTTHEYGTSTTPATQNQTFSETSADRATSNGLRAAFLSQQNLNSELQNIRITTHNGVVTLSGTVSSNEVRNSFNNAAQNYPGVNQVINNLQVR